jgi:antitoxin HicB
MANKHKGSSFDNFLEEEGILEHAEAVSIKRVIAYQISETMKKKKVSKVVLTKKNGD